MSAFDQISSIDLFDGLNISPIPLEFSQEMTTTKILAAIQAKVNEIIDFRNNAVSDANNYTDEQIKILNDVLTVLQNNLNLGTLVPKGSLTLDKFNSDFLSNLNNLIQNQLSQSAKFVSFGIDDNGYFYADIPDNWNGVTFDTDSDGHLILEC
jgi:hypothetical protein